METHQERARRILDDPRLVLANIDPARLVGRSNCAVCSNNQRARIDKLLLTGTPPKEIPAAIGLKQGLPGAHNAPLGLTPAALIQHRDICLTSALERALVLDPNHGPELAKTTAVRMAVYLDALVQVALSSAETLRAAGDHAEAARVALAAASLLVPHLTAPLPQTAPAATPSPPEAQPEQDRP